MPDRTDSLLAAAFERNVLLIDSVESRQLARAAAMRQAGATVQCVSTGDAARAVWKPGSHQLVLIELAGAGPDAREFYDYARALNARQAFAFYTDEPPYLSATPGGRAARTARPHPTTAKPSGAARLGARISFAEASQKMAVARAARPAESAAASPSSASRPSFSDAVKAAEDEAAARNVQE
jgi:CheY-like chemotaxis protein